MGDRIYHECMQVTQALKFCPNAFRVDMYRGCDFGCKYCFADIPAFNWEDDTFKEADFKSVERAFEIAYSNKPSKSVVVEMIRNRVPIHCGGMADPFQMREWKFGLTKKLIELSNKYNYPIQFSTKVANLPDEYWDILNPEIHAFQVSIMGWSDEYIRRWERRTPSAKERLEFVRKLRSKGFWCAIRIQPVIDVSECLKLISEAGSVPSYYSVEHLRLFYNSTEEEKELVNEDIDVTKYVRKQHKMEMRPDVKLQNLLKIIELANSYGVKVGAADNELHCYSQSRCCCGLDTINDNFSNYIKYNLTYFATGDSDLANIWYPKSNLRRHLKSSTKNVVLFKDYVDDYVRKNLDLIPDQRRINIEKALFGTYRKRLF